MARAVVIIHSLPESASLPSARGFAEHFFRTLDKEGFAESQIKTLGKASAHGKEGFAECQIKNTR
jgi:hypothetical protein